MIAASRVTGLPAERLLEMPVDEIKAWCRAAADAEDLLEEWLPDDA